MRLLIGGGTGFIQIHVTNIHGKTRHDFVNGLLKGLHIHTSCIEYFFQRLAVVISFSGSRLICSKACNCLYEAVQHRKRMIWELCIVLRII